jgi:hypothetical protein
MVIRIRSIFREMEGRRKDVKENSDFVGWGWTVGGGGGG